MQVCQKIYCLHLKKHGSGVGTTTFGLNFKKRFYYRNGLQYFIKFNGFLDIGNPFESYDNDFQGSTDVVMLFFSIVDRDSFNEVESKLAPHVRRYSKGRPFILIGTKLDLRNDDVTITRMKRLKNTRPVTKEEGEAMAKRIGALSYHEYSASMPETLTEVWDKVFNIFIDPPARRKSDKSCNIL